MSYDASGARFDSKKELKRWEELNLLLRAGEIKKLARQVPYVLTVNGVKVCTYKADFVFWERYALSNVGPESHIRGEFWAWREVIEDVKGVRTAVYVIKKKLMKACYGIDIKET